MLVIQDQSFSSLETLARRSFVELLSQDLYSTFPEKFHAFSKQNLAQYVESRITYAAHFGITHEDCIAELAMIECQSGSDFLKDHENGWWRAVIEDDMPQDFRVGSLSAQLSCIEVEPGFTTRGH